MEIDVEYKWLIRDAVDDRFETNVEDKPMLESETADKTWEKMSRIL